MRSSTGALVPLDTMTKMTKQVRPASISQFGQLPATTISFNLKACFSLGQAADQVDAAIRDLRLPPGMLSS